MCCFVLFCFPFGEQYRLDNQDSLTKTIHVIWIYFYLYFIEPSEFSHFLYLMPFLRSERFPHAFFFNVASVLCVLPYLPSLIVAPTYRISPPNLLSPLSLFSSLFFSVFWEFLKFIFLFTYSIFWGVSSMRYSLLAHSFFTVLFIHLWIVFLLFIFIN